MKSNKSKSSIVKTIPLPGFSLWDRMKKAGKLVGFDLEITARCNNNCRHCYVNVPFDDRKAQKKELSLSQIKKIADEAVSLGALWCLITGGEPLVRKDFVEIYLYLKKKGLLVSVFTNATLITDRHIEIFKKYPPRDIEVTVYGVTPETYEKVTGNPGVFRYFSRSVEKLLAAGIKVRFKAMAIRSNVHELHAIAEFCRKRTKDYFRFDPFLHMRFDRNENRNEMIKSERLSAQEIVDIERSDRERFQALLSGCDQFITPESSYYEGNHLFHCGTGTSSFGVTHDGYLKLCSSLAHPQFMYDITKVPLSLFFRKYIPMVRDMRSTRKVFLTACRVCPIINLCTWCPAHAYLETGELDKPVQYFCDVAHAREQSIKDTSHGGIDA